MIYESRKISGSNRAPTQERRTPEREREEDWVIYNIPGRNHGAVTWGNWPLRDPVGLLQVGCERPITECGPGIQLSPKSGCKRPELQCSRWSRGHTPPQAPNPTFKGSSVARECLPPATCLPRKRRTTATTTVTNLARSAGGESLFGPVYSLFKWAF